jgi:ATP synthase F0 subunit b
MFAELHGPIAFEFPELTLSLILGFVLFVLLVLRMPKDIPLGIPFLRQTMQERQARIADNSRQVENQLADVQRLHDDYAARLQRIETEARARIEAAARDADAAKADIIAEAQQSAQAIRRRSEEEMARQRRRHRSLLHRQIVQITLDAAEQSIQAHSNDAIQRQLIQDFIARASTDGGVRSVTARAADGASARPSTPPSTQGDA